MCIRDRFCAVNRLTRSGVRLDQNERVSVLDALRGVTINAAAQYFEEGEKGSIAPGKRADLILLSEDPRAVPAEELRRIRVLETFKDGVAVYKRQSLCRTERRSKPQKNRSSPTGRITCRRRG